MEYNKPLHINSEKDLEHYEEYLKENFNNIIEIEDKKALIPQNRFSIPKALESPIFSNGYLRKTKGKLLKVESLVGNTLDTRIGILLDVGADYIAIKINKSCCSLIIPTASIKYITVIHDNDITKAAT